MPNICMTIYKNRGGAENEVKIWLYVDYSTMRVHDLFVTDNEYAILDIEKELVYLDEDKKLHVFNNVNDLNNFRMQAIKNMSAIPDEEWSDEERQEVEQNHQQLEDDDKVNPIDDMFVVLDDYGETTAEKGRLTSELESDINIIINTNESKNESEETNNTDEDDDDDFNW